MRKIMSDLEIYEQTQKLAMIIARESGVEPIKANDFSIFSHLQRSPKIKQFFNCACEIQVFLNDHEMSDACDSYEEYLLDKYSGYSSSKDLAIATEKAHSTALVINKELSLIKNKPTRTP